MNVRNFGIHKKTSFISISLYVNTNVNESFFYVQMCDKQMYFIY